ncbi:sugar phosphate isomerase/epimerase family protein [Feifania hominis]|nr:sugar phosphate isomerase/epimerase [Feifania hominis]
MTKYLRMGTVHFMSYPDVLADESRIVPTVRRLLADPYFSVLEIAHIRDPEIRREVRALFEHSDCGFVFAAQPEQLGQKINLNSLDGSERRRAVETLKARIDEAYEMGAEGFGFISGGFDPAHRDEQLALFTESCRELCDYAAGLGDLFLEVEQFDFDFHNRLLIGPAELTARLAENMTDRDNFGVLVDLSHLPLVHETPRECLRHLGGHITHAHIGNAVCRRADDYLYGDFHPRFSVPHSAVGPEQVAEFLRELFAVGFLGGDRRPVVSFEIKAWQGDDPEAVLAECKRVMDLAWALA